MINHFDKKYAEHLISGHELDKMSCIKCETKLRDSFEQSSLMSKIKIDELENELKKEHFKLSEFPGFLHEIKRKGKQIDHQKNWESILEKKSRYLVNEKLMLIVYIKFMECGGEKYATNVGVTTLKEYNSSSLGDLSFSENIKDGISKRLIHLSDKELKWYRDQIYIIPVCCRRCANNIEAKLRYDLNLLDT